MTVGAGGGGGEREGADGMSREKILSWRLSLDCPLSDGMSLRCESSQSFRCFTNCAQTKRAGPI